MPAAGAAADSPDQKGDKGQVRSSTAGRFKGSNRRYGKSLCLEPPQGTVSGTWTDLRHTLALNGKSQSTFGFDFKSGTN